MKNSKKVLTMVFLLVFMFTVVMSSAVFAGTDNGKGNEKGSSTTTDTGKVKGNDKAELKGTETEDSTVENGDTLETEEEKAVKEKDKVMEQKKDLKKQLIEARKSGDTVAEAELLAQIKTYMESLKKIVEESYTKEELAQLEQAAESIEASDPSLEVLPVEKIIAKGRSLKFDLPPVIKEGKVLVPIRAFSQAYGADVQWNSETHEITILKGGIAIVINIDTNTATIGDQVINLEMPVKSINGRAVMPVGFLAEQLGLTVEVDEEDGTVEIEEVEETEEVDTTVGE